MLTCAFIIHHSFFIVRPWFLESTFKEKIIMPLLAAENVTKSYFKKKLQIPVLKGVDFEVQEGEFVAIVGQSGSGKSTLLHLLGTLDKPDTGIIRFHSERIDNLPARRRDILRNRSIGFIFQFYHLLPELTVLENVLSPLMIRSSVLGYWFSRSQYHAKAGKLLEQVGLLHRLKHKPSELSGGEMQRTAIARALVSEPAILLADEPTGNLDASSAKEVISLLRQLCTQHRLSVVMVTHDENIAAVADRKVRMIDGRIF
ncbi:MAG: ABC transporter ATP-binding protein [Planctomycetaceae bacterium]|nr:ABC transporter ATP-binding protein [Planctomycetaceae bacterium]